MPFKQPTPQQRESAKLRRAEDRKRFLSRIAHEALTACFSYVAYSDGAPTDRKILASQDCLARLFDKNPGMGRPSGLDLTPLSHEGLSRKLRSYLTACTPSVAARKRLVNELYEFATCDSAISRYEERAIGEISDLLQLDKIKQTKLRRRLSSKQFAAGKGDAHGRATSRKATGVKKRPAPPPGCYDILGCNETDSDETIKRCYRQLAVKLHPDKHVARSASPDDMMPHIRAFQELQAAYQEVLKRRSGGTSRAARTTARA